MLALRCKELLLLLLTIDIFEIMIANEITELRMYGVEIVKVSKTKYFTVPN